MTINTFRGIYFTLFTLLYCSDNKLMLMADTRVYKEVTATQSSAHLCPDLAGLSPQICSCLKFSSEADS